MLQINFPCLNPALMILIFSKHNSVSPTNSPLQSKPSGGHLEIQANNFKTKPICSFQGHCNNTEFCLFIPIKNIWKVFCVGLCWQKSIYIYICLCNNIYTDSWKIICLMTGFNLNLINMRGKGKAKAFVDCFPS